MKLTPMWIKRTIEQAKLIEYASDHYREHQSMNKLLKFNSKSEIELVKIYPVLF